VNVWKDLPEVHQLLKDTAITKLMEPVPQPLLKPTMTLSEVGRAFVEHSNEFFYVSADGQTLDGVITITDLLRGRSCGATGATPASEFMAKNPVALAADDTCALASSALREYRLKSLPIVDHKENRKLLGCIRFRRIMAYLFKELESQPEKPKGESKQG